MKTSGIARKSTFSRSIASRQVLVSNERERLAVGQSSHDAVVVGRTPRLGGVKASGQQ